MIASCRRVLDAASQADSAFSGQHRTRRSVRLNHPGGSPVTERMSGDAVTVLQGRGVRVEALIPGWPRFGSRRPVGHRIVDVSGCDLYEVLIEGAEGAAGQWLLRSSAECAHAGGADRVGGLVEESGCLGGVGARVLVVAAAQLGCGEIDEDQHALSTRRLASLAERCGECLACAAVVTGPQKGVTSHGAQVRATRAKRCGRAAAGRLVEGSVRTIEGLACTSMVTLVRPNGGLDGG
jgi:hypothetical protein